MKILVPLWQEGQAYLVNDGVEFQGRYFRCVQSHTSTSTFDTVRFQPIGLGTFYTSASRAAIFSDNIAAVDIVEFHLPTPVFLNTGGVNITLQTPTSPNNSTNVYTAQGEFIGFSNVTEDFDVKVGKFSIFLSGLTVLTETFSDPTISGLRVVIYKCFLDANTGVVLDQPYMLFDGQINNVNITESRRSCSLSVDCASIFADFERSTGRKTNNESNWLYQKVKYDTTFEKTGLLRNTEIKWGRLN
jgi:hypothetical protein